MVVVESVIPFPRGWERRSTAEGWDNFRVFISPIIPAGPNATNTKVYEQVIPFPKPWEKRHAAEPWDTFRLVYGATASPPPPAGAGTPIINQVIPFPRDGTMDARRPDGWTLFRPFWSGQPTIVHSESSLRFWPDDEARRAAGWQWFRMYWQDPGAPPPPPTAPWQAYRVPPSGWAESTDSAKRIDHWQQFRPYWTQPAIVPTPDVPVPPPGYGGAVTGPKGFHVVVIDNEEFRVQNEEQAEALMEMLRLEAEKKANKEAREIVNKRIRKALKSKKPVNVMPLRLDVPDIKGNETVIAPYQNIIQLAYEQAAMDALQALMVARQLQDDEDALIALL
jgi:hypothetical protein